MSSSPPSSPSPFLSRFWPMLVLLLAAVGVPAAAITVFSHFITDHPLLALGIALLYEVGVVILGFLGKIWQNLESRWVDRIANWLDHLVQTGISRYRRHYYHYLGYQHRDFDVKGLSTLGPYALELGQVFVELSIDPTAPQQVTSNPIQLPPVLLEGSHAIWDYLISASLYNQHLVIIGPPGSGKTTLLKHITLTQVLHLKQRPRTHQAKMSCEVPILLFLRDHAQAINEQQGFSLVDAVHDHLKKWEQPLPPEGWFKRQLSKGRCLVMLDGLDEVADPGVRQAVVTWVERQMAAYSRNRFLVTSRPLGYRSNPLSSVTVLEVRPFTPEQVERFIDKWYLANEIMSKQKDDPGVRMRAKMNAKVLLQRLRNTPALFDLTTNPLLLTMIATVHRYGGELPGNRVALYAEICEVFLGKRQLARGQELELAPAQMQLVLEPLAHHMMVQGIRDIACEEAQTAIKEPLTWVSTHLSSEAFLQKVEQVSGLLLERENGVYSFAHQTFQEYLAASYIREKQLGDILVARTGESWWRETILLHCAMVDATPIIAACLEGERPSATAIELAIDCDKGARKVQPEVRTRLETLLKEGMEDPDPERQHVIAGALLARRLRQMVHLQGETFVDTSLITCAEYQVFLDEQRAQGRYLQPDHWSSYHFPSGQGNEPVLGARQSDTEAFCKWLTEREPGPWLYRLPEAGDLKDESLLSSLPVGTCYWLKDEKECSWPRGVPPLPGNIVQEVEQIFELKRTFVHNRTLESSCQRALDLDYIFKSQSVLLQTLKRQHQRDLDLERHQKLEREFEREIQRQHQQELERQQILALQSELELQQQHLLALQHGLELESQRQSQLQHDLAYQNELEQQRQSQLQRLLVDQRDLQRQRDLQQQLNLQRQRILALQHDLERQSQRLLDLERERQQILERLGEHRLQLPDVQQHLLALQHDLELQSQRLLDLSRQLESERQSQRQRQRVFVRQRQQELRVELSNILTSDQEKPSTRRGIRRFFRCVRTRKSVEELQYLVSSWLEISVDLLILEKRIRGELPACEGILIVKESKQNLIEDLAEIEDLGDEGDIGIRRWSNRSPRPLK